MRLPGSIFSMFLLALFLLLLSSCKKEDETAAKEAVIRNLLADINADSLQNDVLWMQNMGNRFSLAENHRDVAVKLMEKFHETGYENARLDSFNIIKTFRGVDYTQVQYNVIASIEGYEYPDSACVVGGHYDNILSTSDLTVIPGANDNASGVAAVIEIARVMKKNDFRPKSTIVFIAFGAEEIGMYGSKDYASDPDGYSGKIRFMLNSDMIAYEPSAIETGWNVNIVDYQNSFTLRLEAEVICNRYTLLHPKNDNTYFNRSDSYSFFTNGYKALFFFSWDVAPNYHTVNDVAEECNFQYCREIVKLQCALLADKN
jgi:acetylornithine deacetylase/succinyl-diaminopimelate desuccinylase-like protein